ncbi:MAG: NAD(FAD)-utilizing dehydrogenase [Eubacteriales bacterium]|nr:NAD(FAD)-utilizing dehydrogenase [Eubacteriales bacterium]MDD4390348.1 NAD(FAD)-utilizing dehydrogenase [Eubacteriales bacterium]
MYRIHEIKLSLDEDKNCLPEKIEKLFSKELKGFKIKEWRIVRESIDARHKNDIKRVYTVDFNPGDEVELNLEKGEEVIYELPICKNINSKGRPIVCGFGPCGIFAALVLAQAGLKPLVIERGRAMPGRVRDVNVFWEKGELNDESNVQFGEGGAGTFSDGKLTTGLKDKRIRKVLEEFCKAGADEQILYKQKPHIGTDKLRGIVVNLRKTIEELGGEIIFESKLTDIFIDDGEISAIEINGGTRIECSDLILAIGHSARDTFRMLFSKGVPMEQKPFSIGLRIEHSQEMINDAQYGQAWRKYSLPPAEYKLAHRCKNNRGVYTFCMCPGGEVIVSSSEQGKIVINGMSNNSRNGKNGNSALLVDVRVEDFDTKHPLAGIEFQEKYERLAYENAKMTFNPPKTTWLEFSRKESSSYPVRNSLPKFAVDAIEEAMPFLARRLRGFDSKDAILTAPETRSSSPVRIKRGNDFLSEVAGLYPAGEGAGYAGGIVSAAVDGIKIAEAVIETYK